LTEESHQVSAPTFSAPISSKVIKQPQGTEPQSSKHQLPAFVPIHKPSPTKQQPAQNGAADESQPSTTDDLFAQEVFPPQQGLVEDVSECKPCPQGDERGY
jgi:hypothetical protein